jgi:hypothetical protein
MSFAFAGPLVVVVVTAVLSVVTVRRLELEARALHTALDDLADLPALLATLRAETQATGVSARIRPNP